MRGFGKTTMVVGLAMAVAPLGRAQNFLPATNGTDNILSFPWSPGGNAHNLYYRCFPKDILWPPQFGPGTGSFAGLDLTGFQLAFASKQHMLGSPLIFFTQDPSATCILSAAIGGSFPPTIGKISSSPNTLGAFYFYTSVPCTMPFAWTFSFLGTPFAGTATPPQNLLFGWADSNAATTASMSYVVASTDEVASDGSWSYAVPVNAGMGRVRAPQSVEWSNVFLLGETTANPSRPGDIGGRGGYTPLLGGSVVIHAMDWIEAGMGTLALAGANMMFPGGAAAHAPGITLLGQHYPLNADPLLLALLGLPFTGGAYSPRSVIGPFWNPSAGWTPGGEAVSPPLPLPPGAVGLRFGAAVASVNLAGPPVVRDASNGSQFEPR